MKVAVLGSTGETGRSIVDGLIKAVPPISITALVRQSSLQDPSTQDLQDRGVQVLPVDLATSEDKLTDAVRGFDVVISAISALNTSVQISLVNAVKAADVGRFVPAFFAPVMPRGIQAVRDEKELILDHIKQNRVPYTVIDIGFWYQIAAPRLPSGRTNYVSPVAFDRITGDGNAASGYTDLRDIGRWVARIIADRGTLNKMIFAFNEVLTTSQMYDTLEGISGETIPRSHIDHREVLAGVKRSKEAALSPSSADYFDYTKFEYWNTLYVRQDNTPEFAEYLGYIDARKLYPDLVTTTFKEFCQQALDGRVRGVYRNMGGASLAAMATQT